ncbi:MAG: hypothetical protein A4E31_01384 [Methanomassiliicoccales archaeon PtaU1.Bin030]|nr:MAG: hypothetical protein A4E31_01384 [Methanomassiliicoccales archaeon PtaU1.Bin030]
MGRRNLILAWLDDRRYVLAAAILISLTLTCIIFSSFLLKAGVVNAGDLTWPYFNEPGLTGLYLDNTQSGLIPSQMLVYSWLFYLPLDTAIQERLLLMGVFFLMGFSCYYATFRILLQEGAERKLAYLVAGAATIAYVVNPLNFYYLVDLFLLIGFALVPPLVYVVLRFQRSNGTIKDILVHGVLTGLIMTASSGDPRWPIWDLFLIGIIVLVYLVLGRFRGLAKSVGFLIVSGICFTALSAFWIVPTLVASGHSTLLTRSNLSVNFYYVLNKYATLENTIVLQSDFWTPSRELFLISDSLLNSIWRAAQLVLPALAFMSLLLFRRNRSVISLLIISIIVILLASAPLSPFQLLKDAYQSLVFEAPFGIAFRTSYKWLLILVYPYVLLASFTILGLSRLPSRLNIRVPKLNLDGRRLTKVVAGTLVTLLASSSLIAAWPLVTGDCRGVIAPEELSSDYIEAYDIIEQASGGDLSFKILYLPSNPYTGFEAPGLADSPYLHYIITNLESGNVNTVGGLLAPLGVKYIILDKSDYSKNVMDSSLRNQTDLMIRFEGEQLLVLENEEYSDQFRLSDLALSFDGIESGAALSAWDGWVQTDQDFLDLEDVYDLAPYLLMGSGYPYNLIATKSITSSPFKYVPYYGDQSWTCLVAYNPSNYEWYQALKTMGLENWDLDYGEGLAYTNVSLSYPRDLPIPDAALVKYFDLSNRSTVQEFIDNNYQEQFGARLTYTQELNYMKVRLLDSTDGWKTICSPLVNVSFGQTYAIRMNMASDNGFEIHIKVAEYDENGTLLSFKPLSGLGSGKIPWTTVPLSYVCNNSDVKKISIQIWHGSRTTTPLPNAIYIKDISIYNTSILLSSPRLDGKIEVATEGEYHVYVRALSSPQGGNLTMEIDGVTARLETVGKESVMKWMYCGTMNLSAGVHDVLVLNTDGLNAVNLVSLIDVGEYSSLLERYNSKLAEKAQVYVLDNGVRTRSTELKLNNDSSIGPLGEYLAMDAEIEVFLEGSYLFYAQNVSDGSLWIDGNEAGSLNATTHYLTVHLDEGVHNIALLADAVSYSAGEVLLFSANAGNNLASLNEFGSTVGGITAVEKKSASSYDLRLSTDGPSALVFNNAFDSAWIVTSDGGETISSIPVNTAQNGFVIMESVNTSLSLSYSLDRYYILGMMISLIALATMVAGAIIYYSGYGRLLIAKVRGKRNGNGQ